MHEITIGMLMLVGFKSILGFRFPWETSNCCGKKIREHKGAYKFSAHKFSTANWYNAN